MNTPAQNSKDLEKETNPWLYRIIPFQRLADILINKKNTLVNPSKWDDPFEDWILNKNPSAQVNKCNFFGQCWTIENKSEAIWRVNSIGTDGFRIRTKVDKLWNSLNGMEDREYIFCKIGEISYLEKNEIKKLKEGSSFNVSILRQDKLQISKQFPENISDLIDGFMIKRLGYQYEYEIRLICYNSKNKQEGIKRYSICPNDVIEQILIHPRVDDDDACRIKCTLKKLGFTGEIKRSELNNMD